MKARLLAMLPAAFAIAAPAPALAQKWTVSCGPATLVAQDKGAKDPYEVLEVRRFVLKVDVTAKSCAVDSVEATYAKAKSSPIAIKDPAAKCMLNVTNKGRVFMDGRANLKGDKVLASPILTVNYEVRAAPPSAGSPDSMGKYFVVSGFPMLKTKGAQIDNQAKAACTQAK